MAFMYTIICKTHCDHTSRPNRLRVATLFFGDVPGASVLTRFADRAKKTQAIFLMGLKKEQEFLMVLFKVMIKEVKNCNIVLIL